MDNKKCIKKNEKQSSDESSLMLNQIVEELAKSDLFENELNNKIEKIKKTYKKDFDKIKTKINNILNQTFYNLKNIKINIDIKYEGTESFFFSSVDDKDDKEMEKNQSIVLKHLDDIKNIFDINYLFKKDYFGTLCYMRFVLVANITCQTNTDNLLLNKLLFKNNFILTKENYLNDNDFKEKVLFDLFEQIFTAESIFNNDRYALDFNFSSVGKEIDFCLFDKEENSSVICTDGLFSDNFIDSFNYFLEDVNGKFLESFYNSKFFDNKK